jgi:hypothetical protein
MMIVHLVKALVGPIPGSLALLLMNSPTCGSDVVGNVAVSAGHRFRDADPGRGDHVPTDVDVLFPELLAKLPGLVGLYREDVLQVHGDVEGGRKFCTTVPLMNPSARFHSEK